MLYSFISYVYCLIVQAATWGSSFLHHLSWFVYWLLGFALTSRVSCLLSVLFCHMSALSWLHQLHSCAHHHRKTVANPHDRGYLLFSNILKQSLPPWWCHCFLVTCLTFKVWEWVFLSPIPDFKRLLAPTGTWQASFHVIWCYIPFVLCLKSDV